MDDILIDRQTAHMLYQVGVTPLHPLVMKEFKESGLNRDVINESLDSALEWTYIGITSTRSLMWELQSGYRFLQDKNRMLSGDPEVIPEWLNSGKHNYFTKEPDCGLYSSDNLVKFPMWGTIIDDDGISVQTSRIFMRDKETLLYKNSLKRFGKNTPMSPAVMESYQIRENKKSFEFPFNWRTDGSGIIGLFQNNFAINYTNMSLKQILHKK